MDTSKIIKGAVSSGRYTVTAPIVKEDYGLYLQIEGVELPSTYEVDFSNSEHNGTSVTMIGNSDGVLIPHQFIDTGKDIFAFLYHVGENFGRTVYKFRIPNKVRPDRTDEEPTPEEQSVIDQAINALNEAVAQTAQDVISADQSAQSAESAKTAAESARDTAGEYANDAQSSAESASESARVATEKATASAESASASAQIKTDVEDLADDAQGYAQASAQSASASANSASQAQGYAQSASASASSAQGYANNAQSYSQTASAKAQDASQSASTASTKATEASQSASQALSYKTDAESAKTASQTAQGLAESARDTAVSAKTDAESAKADAESARDEAQQAVASISGALIDKAPVITDTASGSIASFTDGADNLPLKSLVVDINPVQDLHGQDAPYPAGGGKNLINLPDVAETTKNGVTYSISNGVVSINGTCKSGFAIFNSLIGPFPSDSYTASVNLISGTASTINNSFNFYDSENTRKLIAFGTQSQGQYPIATSFAMSIVKADIVINNGAVFNNAKFSFQLEKGSSATSFAPYSNICPISGWTQATVNHSDADTSNPTTITISLGQTVYGGKLDVLSGVLTVDMAMVDLGTLSNWRYNVGSTGAFDTQVALTPLAKSNTKCICSQYKTLDYPNLGNITNSDFCVGINKKDDGTAYTGAYVVGTLFVKDSRYSDVEAFKTAMNGVMLCYELAEPIEIQLSANQIDSLYGINNIWADSGDTEAEYRADTKLFIERLTAPDSADMIADANIQSGKYFMVGNSLYLATANIANGSAIVVGTNCIRKSLSEALNEINA